VTETLANTVPLSAVPDTVGAGTAAALRIADQRTAAALETAIRSRALDVPPLPSVPVGPFRVADATRTEVVDRLVLAYRLRTPFIAYALHVGGLLSRRDDLYVASMHAADMVYADGVSIVNLAAAAGARRIERAATTDIGEDVLAAVSADPHRRPRVALIGGPAGLADRAADALVARYDLDVVFSTHGFHDDWDAPLSLLHANRPDIVIVGLGAPREMRWVNRHREALGNALVLTCGGWFGFLAGEESRAPRIVQRLSCEWVWRWMQQPRRLARRYVAGAWVCAQLTVALKVAALRRRAPEPAGATTP
jgi:N-acetylglucosaminyldiphosphoundecaprenol N-acetyl-beta-D-mannosaminyltransferase